jgi:transposase
MSHPNEYPVDALELHNPSLPKDASLKGSWVPRNVGLWRARKWMALNEFATEVAASEDKRILLVVDQAGWHPGKEVEVPEGIHLEFLPSGSPELQPAERLWALTNEALANGLFEEIEEIEEALMERCLELLDQTETIRDLTNYNWWPQAA